MARELDSKFLIDINHFCMEHGCSLYYIVRVAVSVDVHRLNVMSRTGFLSEILTVRTTPHSRISVHSTTFRSTIQEFHYQAQTDVDMLLYHLVNRFFINLQSFVKYISKQRIGIQLFLILCAVYVLKLAFLLNCLCLLFSYYSVHIPPPP